MSATNGPGASGRPERRRAARLLMSPEGGPVALMGARVVSVSPVGMKIDAPLPVAEGLVLSFRLVVGGEAADVEARVVQCAPLAGSGRFGLGLEFTDVPEEVRRRLCGLFPRPGPPRA